MKKDQVQVGGRYMAKVSGAVVPVEITGEKWSGEKHVGWVGRNTETGRSVRIKSAQRLRAAARDNGHAPAAGAEAKPQAQDAAGANVGPTGAKGKRAGLRAVAAADQENARVRDERAASPDGMTASERAMAESAGKAKRPAKAAKAPKAAKAKPEKMAKAPKEPKPKRLSALDAAAQVLAASGKAMKATEMIEAMESKGLWKSPGGKTPEATLYAAIIREIAAKGKDARFVKVDRGSFAAGKGT